MSWLILVTQIYTICVQYTVVLYFAYQCFFDDLLFVVRPGDWHWFIGLLLLTYLLLQIDHVITAQTSCI